MSVRRNKKGVRHLYGIVAVVYISICALVLIIGFMDVRGMIEDYNAGQAKLMSGLLTENINMALDTEISQVEEISYAIVGGREDNPNYIYESLQFYAMRSNISGIGFIDYTHTTYGTRGDHLDLAKYGYLSQISEVSDTILTDPYRSRITATMIMTVLVPIYKEGKYFGTVYANIPLDMMQKYVSIDNLKDNADIYLINSHSLNCISCTDGVRAAAGTWDNLTLRRSQMVFEQPGEYQKHVKAMKQGKKGDAFSYELNGVSYTMGYERIDKMEDWYLAVELTNEALSGSFYLFRDRLVMYAVVLVLITLAAGVVMLILEITRRKNFEKLSETDTMTGLYNQKTFIAKVEEYITNAGDGGALIFVDVDNFKSYNDTYGHMNGDAVLRKFATELQTEFGSEHVVARYGGDEFTVFVRHLTNIGMVEMAMERLEQCLSEIDLDNYGRVALNFSAGGACYPQDAVNYADLCKCADAALYRVKKDGKGRFGWYQNS